MSWKHVSVTTFIHTQQIQSDRVVLCHESHFAPALAPYCQRDWPQHRFVQPHANASYPSARTCMRTHTYGRAQTPCNIERTHVPLFNTSMAIITVTRCLWWTSRTQQPWSRNYARSAGLNENVWIMRVEEPHKNVGPAWDANCCLGNAARDKKKIRKWRMSACVYGGVGRHDLHVIQYFSTLAYRNRYFADFVYLLKWIFSNNSAVDKIWTYHPQHRFDN